MRVLTLTPFYPDSKDNTRGCFVAEVLPSLERAGVSNTVIAAQPFYRALGAADSSAVPATWVKYFSIPGNNGLSLSGAFLFARLIGKIRDLHRQDELDLIHAHGALPCGHAAMLIHRELGIPYVVSVHGLDVYSDVQVTGRVGQWCRRVSRLAYHSAGRVLCVSEHVRKVVIDGGIPFRQTSVVYNGADPDLFRPVQQLSQNALSVLSVGNLIPTKGHAILLRALSAIKATHPDLTCEIVGIGPDRERLQQLARELELPKVRFLGRLSRRELAKAFGRCALFVLPSFYEGLGCVYLEAMASERVAIGCRGQGIEEIIEHGKNGWLVDPESSYDLATGLTTLLSNAAERDTIAVGGRQTILRGFTLAHQAERLGAIYREIGQ